MTAAIYYHPEAYTTQSPKLMGRHAAGESFLRGFLAYSTSKEFWVQVQRREHARHFAQAAHLLERGEPIRVVDKHNLGLLTKAGVVYHPGPGIGAHAWHRAAFGHGAWSLCGITHTTASAGAMDALVELITAPVQPWDALICTSTAVKSHIERLVQAQVDYLKERLGITKLVMPQLPVIPLGVHTQEFVFSDEQKAKARASLGVDQRSLVVLFMGRLSFHAKAHPLAMYQALESAAKATDQKVVLVECGWHANDYIARAFSEAAKSACPSVQVITSDGRQAEHRRTAWAAADVFCSLSDNIQETFGLTPVEAMAAGLPVVVSDWDGYKDTVRDGVDGFRIPTLMPQAGLGGDLALRHALEIDSYDEYLGLTCSLIAVDVEATAQAFVRLFQSPQLRQKMGEAGRRRARETYDWAAIIPLYEALWARLNELRRSEAAKPKSLPHPWPARMDPFAGFARYPSRTLTPKTQLILADKEARAAIRRALAYRKLAMIDFAKAILPAEAEIEAVLKAAESGPKSAEALVLGLPAERRAYVLRSLTWLIKCGVLKACP